MPTTSDPATDPVPAGDRDLIASLIPAPAVSEHVADWPEDEREFFRHGDWDSFSDRRAKLDKIRRYKVADAILAAGFTRSAS